MPNPAGSSTTKRILALDGGGVRGIVTLAFLERMEHQLREELGKPNLVLADHFDLIGGTSVGSIIATMLALGWPMEKVTTTFQAWCPEIFSSPMGWGIFGAKFRAGALTRHLAATLEDMRLDSPLLKTRLAVITKRLDTGSPWWIVTNIPNSRFWNGPNPEDKNHALRVADLIRASTAAPTVFKPKMLPLAPGRAYGLFVDGGISPFNNPALALLMTARLAGHGLEWPLGSENLQLISIGTGVWREPVYCSFWGRRIAAWLGIVAMRGMINDSQTLSLAILQWMSSPRLSWRINSEIGDLAGEVLGVGFGPYDSMLKFQRYDLELEATKLATLMGGKSPSPAKLGQLRSLDNPKEMKTLYQLAKKAAEVQVRVEDFL
jgi:uncharacterized protein